MRGFFKGNTSSVSGAGNPPTTAIRGPLPLASDLRAAVAAASSNAILTDVSRVAPDGRTLKGVRLQANGGTNCSVDFNIVANLFATSRLNLLAYYDPAASGIDLPLTWFVAENNGFANYYNRNGLTALAAGWHNFAPAAVGSGSPSPWTATGTAAWGTTNFTRMRFRMDYTAGQTPWVELYEVGYNEDAAKSWISLTIDDGYDSAYLLAAPALERWGLRASFAIIADLIGQPNYMTLSQLLDLDARGHEIIVHGPLGGTGSLQNYSASATRSADVYNDIAFHQSFIKRNGLNRNGSANIYVFPQGYDQFAQGDETIRNALRSLGFVGGRLASPGGYLSKRNVRGHFAFGQRIIGHTWASAGAEPGNITAINALVNAAVTDKADAVLMNHKFVTGAAANSLEIQVSNFETILAQIVANQTAGTQEAVLYSRMCYSTAGVTQPIGVSYT